MMARARNNANFVLTFNTERAKVIFPIIARAWEKRSNSSTFGAIVSPEVRLAPKEITAGGKYHARLEHAQLLFAFGFLNRNGKRADLLISAATELWHEEPTLFDSRYLDYLAEYHFEPLRPIIPHASHLNHLSRVNWWLQYQQLLHEKYDDDPRKIITENLTYNVLEDRATIIKKFEEFKGIGQKIAQLITCWYQEVEWRDLDADWQYIRLIPAIPADLWVGRLVYQFGLVNSWSSDHSQTILRKVGDFISQTCFENEINHNNLIQGLWAQGAYICAKRPKNPFRAFSEYCPKCPATTFCLGIVPPNYVKLAINDPRNTGGRRPTRRVSSLCWGKFIRKPESLRLIQPNIFI
jgi:hypothetical protein